MLPAIHSFLESGPITNGCLFLATEEKKDDSATTIRGIISTQYFHVTVTVPDADDRAALEGTPIRTLVDKWERDSKRAAAMAKARQKLAATTFADSPLSLAGLRLSKGFSQARLAELLGTKQPYIARIEKGEVDLQVSTLSRLAEVFQVEEIDVLKAFKSTRSQSVK